MKTCVNCERLQSCSVRHFVTAKRSAVSRAAAKGCARYRKSRRVK